MRARWVCAAALSLLGGCQDGVALGSGSAGPDSAGSGDPTGGSADAADDDDDDDEGGGGGGASCPAPPDQGFVDGLAHLGRAQGDTFIEILDVIADGSLVYSCTATQGLTIWDATDASQSALLVENVGPPGLAHNAFPRCQNLGYDASTLRMVITNRGDEVQPDPWLSLYDVTDPTAPLELRSLQTTASVEGVVLEGDRIWAAAHKDGIVVIDDTGTELTIAGGWSDEDSDAWKPFKVGDTLFVAEGTTGLRSYDVSGDAPVLLDTVALPGSSKDVVVRDGVAYVASSAFIAAVDVSDPTAMSVITEREVRGTALALDIGTDDVLMVAEWDEIRGYDLRDNTLAEVMSETVPRDGASFSRVLTLDAEPDEARVYAGEWRGMHAYDQIAGSFGPEVVATPQSLQFGTVTPGDFDDAVLVVRNVGDEPLEIFGVTSDIDGVSALPACATVMPDSAAAIEIRFEPGSDATQRGRVTLLTNDPDEPAFEVTLSANVAGLDIGDPAPSFNLADLEGNTWSLDGLQGSVVVLAYFATF